MIRKLAQSTQPAGKGAGTQPRFSGSRAQAPSILVVQFCPRLPPARPCSRTQARGGHRPPQHGVLGRWVMPHPGLIISGLE